MIRIRKNDGGVVVVPDASFVEIYDPTTDAIGEVLYQPRRDCVARIEPGTRDADRYAGMFRRCGVKFIEKIINRAS